MDNDQASTTALMTAYCRCHHALHDKPLIFEDRLAGQILGEEGRDVIESMLLGSLQRCNPASAAAFPDRMSAISWMMQTGAGAAITLARARYAEEKLEQCIGAGVSQYVILGAGLDTFAFRRPDLMNKLTVFELDHPASQRQKLDRIRDLGWKCPANLHFVALDFARDDLGKKLERSGFAPGGKTFFSWLGVSYYLRLDKVRATLHQLAQIAPSENVLVFDYLDSAAYCPDTASSRVVRMLSSVLEIGEPMLSGFDAHNLGNELADCGITLLENLGPFDIQQRYFLGRIDHYRACEHTHFAEVMLGH